MLTGCSVTVGVEPQAGAFGIPALAEGRKCEESSDTHAVTVARVVSVTPPTPALTSRVGLASLESHLRGAPGAAAGLL